MAAGRSAVPAAEASGGERDHECHGCVEPDHYRQDEHLQAPKNGRRRAGQCGGRSGRPLRRRPGPSSAYGSSRQTVAAPTQPGRARGGVDVAQQRRVVEPVAELRHGAVAAVEKARACTDSRGAPRYAVPVFPATKTPNVAESTTSNTASPVSLSTLPEPFGRCPRSAQVSPSLFSLRSLRRCFDAQPCAGTCPTRSRSDHVRGAARTSS